jgi:hypothetical protein
VLSVHRKVFSAAYKYQVPLLLVRPRLYREPTLSKTSRRTGLLP